jgi:hypothetical protein
MTFPSNNGTTFADVVGFVVGIINLIMPVLAAAALVIFLYSCFRYIVKSGESKGKGTERSAIVWGLVSLFVIVSVWGIVRIMCNTLLGDYSCQATKVTTQSNAGLHYYYQIN